MIKYIFLIFSITVFSQKKKSTDIGEFKKEEVLLKFYEKDSTANALVLFEHANVYVDEKNDYDFRTDYYFRIKIFDKSAFDLANIQISLYKKEKVVDIKAVTYTEEDGIVKETYLLDEEIFTTELNEVWKEARFAMPNIKEGCVIEYKYSVLGPYPTLDDWYFQSEIPKLESKYDAALLGNYNYNLRLIGFEKLDEKESSVRKNCVYMPGVGSGNCAVYSFGMKDIPAFKEEDYMLSKKNFMSRLVLDLISITQIDGSKRRYTKTWKDVDKTLRVNFLDNQTSKKGYFKSKLPENLLNATSDFEKAKAVYKFIQSKLSWNKKYWTREKLRIKNVFEEGSGSVDAINLILYNSLQAADIESYLVALSTRDNGLPTDLYPVVNDFNYVLVKAVIDGNSYFLDATDKSLAFGQVPFKCINGNARVLDFKKGSYWETINSEINTFTTTRARVAFNEENVLEGEMKVVKNGYHAIKERKYLANMSDDDYMDDFETKFPYYELQTYEVQNLEDVEKPLRQHFDILIEKELENNLVSINPFFYGKTKSNPFKLDERKYPVDYGYSHTYSYMLELEVPEDYEVLSIPESTTFALPNQGGRYILNANQKDNKIHLQVKQIIAKKLFSSEEYHYLKEFFNQIIALEKATIELKKI